MSDPALVAAVLAAGSGSRFGGLKQLAELEGRPLLARVIEALDGFAARQVVVVGAEAERVEPLVAELGWTAVPAPDWERGQGASLRAGLAAAPEASRALVALADLPWLRREAVERVLATAAAEPPEVEVVRPFEGEVPGHPLLLRGPALELARSAPDEGLRAFLRDHRTAAVECSGLGVARDVDLPSDLGKDAPAAGRGEYDRSHG